VTKTRPEIEFVHVFDIEPSVGTVRAFGYDIPQEFKIRYFIRSENPHSNVCWSIGLEVEITDKGKPQTKAIDFQGDVWRIGRKDSRGRDLYWPVTGYPERQGLGFAPVDFEKVKMITSSIRTLNHFQSLAVAVVLHSFDLKEGDWVRKRDFPDLSSNELKLVEKKFLQREGRVPRSKIDYDRVRELYDEAKAKGYGVKDYISVHYNEDEEIDGIAPDTVNNWIRTCRDMKLISESKDRKKRNSSPIKSVQDVRKPTTTKKSGESK